jgi:ATP-dependent DNA ligase
MMRKKPMLAYPVSNKPIDYTKPVFMQPKLDGVRCLIQYDNGKVTAYSRTGKVWKNIEHITLGLYRFFDKYPNVILDGELYNHDFKDDFESIISMVRKTKPTAEDRLISAKNVQFHCYDIVDEKLPFKQRIEFINNNLMLLSSSIKIVYTMQITSHENALTFHESFVAGGYEGSILRTNDAYACKRSHNLRKFKDFSDAEATIVGYLDGKGKRTGTLGKFIMQDDNGVEFGCPPGKGYTYKQLGTMLENIGDYIGQRATFTFFERTKAGSYRHPLFKCIRNYE